MATATESHFGSQELLHTETNILSLSSHPNDINNTIDMEEGEICDSDNITNTLNDDNIDNISINNDTDYELPQDFLNYYISQTQSNNNISIFHPTSSIITYDRFGRIKHNDSNSESSGYWSEPPPKDLRFHSDSSTISSSSDLNDNIQNILDVNKLQQLEQLQKLFPWDNNNIFSNKKSKKHTNKYKPQGQYDGKRKLRIKMKKPFKDWDDTYVENIQNNIQYFDDNYDNKCIQINKPMENIVEKPIDSMFEILLTDHIGCNKMNENNNVSEMKQNNVKNVDSYDSFVDLLQCNEEQEEEIVFPMRRKTIVLDTCTFIRHDKDMNDNMEKKEMCISDNDNLNENKSDMSNISKHNMSISK
eukprot:460620_1